MAKHSSLFPPSAAARRLACPGSATMEQKFPYKSSPYAEEGSAAHFLAKYCLIHAVDACEMIGRAIYRMENGCGHFFGVLGGDAKQWIVDKEMSDAVQSYLNYVRNLAPGAKFFVEKRIEVAEGVFGTADHIAVVPFGPLYVSDYKHGVGVVVSPENNPQAMTYALGSLYESPYDHDEAVISIIQPRAREYETIKRWSIPVPELYKWRDEVLLPGIERCKDPKAPLKAGEHCRFCRAFGACPEVNKTALEVSKSRVVAGGHVEFPPVEALTPDEIARVLTYKDLFKKWLGDVESHAVGLISSGEAVPGFKLVEGRSARKWNDIAEATLVCDLGDDAYVKKLIGIGDAEKALRAVGIKGKQLKEYMGCITEKPAGKPTIAPESDKRPALRTDAEKAFENIQIQ